MGSIFSGAPTPPVVIVEDDADFVAILREGVREAGYRPICARDGREALSAILDERPAAVLVDLAMATNVSDLLATLERSPVLSRIPRLIVTRGAPLRPWGSSLVLSHGSQAHPR
jgi:DNA-binding response OmpR family regulator